MEKLRQSCDKGPRLHNYVSAACLENDNCMASTGKNAKRMSDEDDTHC